MVIDSFGQVGSGMVWEGGGISSENSTLRRKCDAEPDTDSSDAFDPSVGWDGFPVDTFDGLGTHCE